MYRLPLRVVPRLRRRLARDRACRPARRHWYAQTIPRLSTERLPTPYNRRRWFSVAIRPDASLPLLYAGATLRVRVATPLLWREEVPQPFAALPFPVSEPLLLPVRRLFSVPPLLPHEGAPPPPLPPVSGGLLLQHEDARVRPTRAGATLPPLAAGQLLPQPRA